MAKTIPPEVSKWMSQLGKVGGSSKSEAKLRARARNAKLGGWPKGRPRKLKKFDLDSDV